MVKCNFTFLCMCVGIFPACMSVTMCMCDVCRGWENGFLFFFKATFKYFLSLLLKCSIWTGEMLQQLRIFVTLPKDSGSVSSTHVTDQNHLQLQSVDIHEDRAPIHIK